MLEERAHKCFHPSSILTPVQPRRRRFFIYRVPSRNLQPPREERSFRLSFSPHLLFSLATKSIPGTLLTFLFYWAQSVFTSRL